MRTTVRMIAAALVMLVMVITTKTTAQQTTVNINGEATKADGAPTFDPELLASLRSSHAGLSEQDALDIAELITAIREDPESMKLLDEMRNGAAQKDFEEMKKTLDDKEIIQYMVKTLDEMKATEVLFANRESAFEEMKKEGMIPAHRIELYAQNPKLLEDDTRKGLFFSMLSLAAAGGYL